MSIKVSFHHQLHYRYDRPIILGPQTLGLRPAPHCKTSIQSYSLKIEPENHTITWQQDPYGNFLARVNVPNKTDFFNIDVDLIVQLQPINPFDFVIENYSSQYPFEYEPQLKKELIPFLEITESGEQLQTWVKQHQQQNIYTPTFLTTINQHLAQEIQYTIRLEPGIQTCESTLNQRLGSCRDTAWLLVQILRHYGLAARFASGYLIQLQSDIPSSNDSTELEIDRGDLHAWTEVYLPGAGWIGLDPTSGFLAAEGHIPLVCTADPQAANPVQGTSEPCTSVLDFDIKVSRFQENYQVNKPYTDSQWKNILATGNKMTEILQRQKIDLKIAAKLIFIFSNQSSHQTLDKSLSNIEFKVLDNEAKAQAKIDDISDLDKWVEAAFNIYEAARINGLQAEQYLLEGRTVSSGNSTISISGEIQQSSLFLKRPDLLRSLITYWHNHPSLQYLFFNQQNKWNRQKSSNLDNLYELELIFQRLDDNSDDALEIMAQCLENYLIDITQNHIDFNHIFNAQKSARNSLQFNCFTMAPHYQMSVLQMLLVRGLITSFLEKPYIQPFIRWGTTIQDRYRLPYFILEDFKTVINDLNQAGYDFELDWFDPFFEFRFPQYGRVTYEGITLELRQAIEPDDETIERIQIFIQNAIGNSENKDSFSQRYQVLCNGQVVPLKSTGTLGEYIGGVRFRTQPPTFIKKSSIASSIFKVEKALLFDVIDTWNQRSIGGCTYCITPPNGMIYQTIPINQREAESRRLERFIQQGHTAGKIQLPSVNYIGEYPFTLDLRRGS